MLNDDNCVSLIHKTVEDAQQHLDVFEVKTRSGFVQNVKRTSRILLGQLGGQLHTLALTARERSARLSQLDISQPHFLQDLNLIQDVGLVLEELHSLIDGHVQHVGDAAATETHFHRLAIISFSAAHLTRHGDIGQEVHLDGLVAVSAAGFATPALDIE